MKLSADIIRDRMFERFKKAIRKFYDQRQQNYFDNFQSKLMSGEITADRTDYKDYCKIEAEKFLATGPADALKFIKNFIHKESDKIFDALEEGTLDKETSVIMLEVLRYILIAGEIEADPKAKIKVRKAKKKK
jgi:hypothetical protein